MKNVILLVTIYHPNIDNESLMKTMKQKVNNIQKVKKYFSKYKFNTITYSFNTLIQPHFDYACFVPGIQI